MITSLIVALLVSFFALWMRWLFVAIVCWVVIAWIVMGWLLALFFTTLFWMVLIAIFMGLMVWLLY
jgi:hypothetical protein